LLALAVLLIVGNTIRLEIENRRAEIEIARLFGATKAFIRRPFLYSGLLYGLIGGILAWFLVGLSFAFLRQPVRKLADLYDSNYDLSILVGREGLLLLVVSAALGTVGAALAVARYLKEVDTPTHRG
jgi:cell division transport system permease protein